MAKFVVLTPGNFAKAFYDDGVHDKIPEGYVPITDDLWQSWLPQTNTAIYDATTKTLSSAPPPPPPPRIVTATRFLIALETLGLLAAWNAAVAASPKPKDQIHANRNADFKEDNPKLARIAALATPPIDLKTVFDAASTL